MYGIQISGIVAAGKIEVVRGKSEGKLKILEACTLTVFLLNESAAAVDTAQYSFEWCLDVYRAHFQSRTLKNSNEIKHWEETFSCYS